MLDMPASEEPTVMEELVEESVVLEPHHLRFREIIFMESEEDKKESRNEGRREGRGGGSILFISIIWLTWLEWYLRV